MVSSSKLLKDSIVSTYYFIGFSDDSAIPPITTDLEVVPMVLKILRFANINNSANPPVPSLPWANGITISILIEATDGHFPNDRICTDHLLVIRKNKFALAEHAARPNMARSTLG